jgi:hypothetical protein
MVVLPTGVAGDATAPPWWQPVSAAAAMPAIAKTSGTHLRLFAPPISANIQSISSAIVPKIAKIGRAGSKAGKWGARGDESGAGSTSVVPGGPYDAHPVPCGGTGATTFCVEVTNTI